MSIYQEDSDLFPKDDETTLNFKKENSIDDDDDDDFEENELKSKDENENSSQEEEEEEEDTIPLVSSLDEKKNGILQKKHSIKRKRQTPVKRTITGDIAVTTQKKRRWRSGTVAIREIKRLQSQTNTLIPHSHIKAVIRELVAERANDPLKMQASSLRALHQAGEIFTIELFEEATRLMIHSKRVELKLKDVKLAAYYLFKGITKNTYRPC